MISERELDILKKSLIFIRKFPETLNISSFDYLKIHKRNIETLEEFAKERKSDFISQKILDYPKISISEIDEYLKWKKKDASIVDLVFGKLLGGVFRLAKNKGNSRSAIQEKLKRISEINENIYSVIENPYIEKMMNK